MHSMPIDFSNDAPKRLNGDAPSGHVKKINKNIFIFMKNILGKVLHCIFIFSNFALSKGDKICALTREIFFLS